ncbi:DNA repair protein RecO [Endozoicomonas sp. Mp262]|uniref:DNA repair protein RecO n=1 Tax=Endozoicomonas sp. Mp262 TaxID=2919499 RepID=UPI0021DAA852
MAWLLHRRPYKESSVIADFLVENHGRVAMVVKGARKGRSLRSTLLQPFSQVAINWRGKGELKTLTTIESVQGYRLDGDGLLCGFYLNELLLRAVLQGQPDEGIAALYATVIEQLASGQLLEPALRFFELELLDLLGYLPSLTHEADTGRPLSAKKNYCFQAGVGLVPLDDSAGIPDSRYGYQVAALKALDARDFTDSAFYPVFKRFTRQALTMVIGDRPLKSRELFIRSNKGTT